MPAVPAYRGRFAPTPSGPLHFGSLVAAAGSYLDAKSRGGEWQVRIDDVDPPRVAAGATDAILRTLEGFGLQWDGPVVFQGRRTQAYRDALERLRARGLVYACTCTRREIADAGLAGVEGPVYPGTCAHLYLDAEGAAMRLRTQGTTIAFDDLLQGHVSQDLARDIGDYVLRRADGVYAYHLACAVDDAFQGITHVVRGADLLASTPRQVHLQRLLGLPTPAYLHLPVAVNAVGEKLSKQTLAPAANVDAAAEILGNVLAFLGHAPPTGLRGADIDEQWQWAIAQWRRERLPRRAQADSGTPS